jgi:hypothetical protein
MTRTRTILVGSLSLLALLVVALTAIAAAAGLNRGPSRVETVSVADPGVERAQVHLSPDVAELVVRALPAGSDALLDGSVALLPRERLERDVDASGDGRIALRARSSFGIDVSVRGPRWDLGLSPDVPAALRIRTGVGDVDLDLRGTKVDRLDSVADIGRQTVRLPDHDLTATLTTDMGRIELIVPHDADVRVDVGLGLRRVDADPGFRRSGGSWHLDGDGATLEVAVRAGMGEVVLRRAPN